MKDDGVKIIERFFTCIDTLKDRQRMPGGLKAFCEKHGINRSWLSYMRTNAQNSSLKAEFVKWLADDYNANATFILFGTGDVLNE